jgi:hypothetical protein
MPPEFFNPLPLQNHNPLTGSIFQQKKSSSASFHPRNLVLQPKLLVSLPILIRKKE